MAGAALTWKVRVCQRRIGIGRIMSPRGGGHETRPWLRAAELLRVAVTVYSVTALAACSAVTVVNGDRVERDIMLGMCSVRPEATGKPLFVSIEGIGVVPTRSGLTVGYVSETSIFLTSADDCRLMVLARHPVDADMALQTMKKLGVDLSNVCVLGGAK